MTALEPKYRILADALRRDIAQGVYCDGDALMTETALKDRYGVSRQTVRQAIALLEEDGLVLRRQGSGTYVTHGPRRRSGVAHVAVITTYITDYIFPSIVRGIERTLSAENCIMSLCATYNRSDRERWLLERMLETPADGLIVEGSQTALDSPNAALYERILQRNIPVVFINGYYAQLRGCERVVMDDEEGGRMAANALLSRGRRRIGGVFKADDMQGVRRHAGYRSALEACAGAQGEVLWFDTGARQALWQRPQGQAFLRKAQEMDGVVCYNDELAVGLLEGLRQAGLSVPGDVSVVSFDNSAYAAMCRPALSSLNHPKDAFGRQAALRLLRLMAGEPADSLVMPWTLVERESIAPR